MGMVVPEGNENGWLAGELGGSTLPDQRLARRLLHIAGRMSASPGQPLPLACQDWAATKAAYRFFDNDRVTEQGVLAGHFAATKSRERFSKAPTLLFNREKLGLIRPCLVVTCHNLRSPMHWSMT